MKTCTRCGIEKPLEEFNRDSSRKDGRHPWCKPCARARRNEWYERNRESNLAYQAEWREKNKARKQQTDRRYRAENSERVRAKDAAYRDANREAIRAYHRQRYLDNPDYFDFHRRKRKARKKAVEHRPYTRRGIYDRDGGRCRLCGTEVPFGPEAHIDHIVPLALKGPDIPSNVQLACSPCNRRKRDHLDGQIHFAC